MSTLPQSQGQMKKHLGKLKSTEARVVVVFHQLPENPTKALVIKPDTLRDPDRDELLSLVENEMAQKEQDLAYYLNKTGHLTYYHNMGVMKPVDIQDVIMLPRPNTPVELKEILAVMGRVVPVSLSSANPLNEKIVEEATRQDSNEAIARSILADARLLQIEVNKKLEQAYAMAPHLRPNSTAPSPTPKAVTSTQPTVTEVKTQMKAARKSRNEIRKAVKETKTTQTKNKK